MRKVLIQVVSVITLVFGTCYQSVLALADDRSRTELSGVQLNDSKGNKLHQVKVNETNELEMTVTVNNKDGENAEGEAAMWLPEDQLKVIQERVEAESAVTDTNATLIFERKNKQPQLHWKDVKTSATFKLKLPVQFTSPMTSMALPIALGSQREYLQPMTAVSADATEDEMKQAGEATQLPANTLQSLTSFIDAQKAQQAQQEQQNAEPEAPAKDENEAKDAAKEQAAKEDAEAKRAADKKAEQDVEDLKKEAAKTDDALKKNSKTVTAESKSDGAKRESQSKKETEAEGRNLNDILAGNTGADKSLFDSVAIEQGGKTTQLDPEKPLDVSDLKDFQVHYKWNSDSLLDKLGDHKIQNGDYYTFTIKGLDYNGDKTAGDLVGNNKEVFARWTITEPEKGQQVVRIQFTNEKANETTVEYELSLSQKYDGKNPIDFEYNEEGIWTGKPVEVKSMLTKEGKFIGGHKIEWTMTLKAQGLKFSELKLEDVINANAEGKKHNFIRDSLKISYAGKEEVEGASLLGKFNAPDFSVANKLTLTGKTPEPGANENDDIIHDDIVIRIQTDYDQAITGSFFNRIGGQVGTDVRMENVSAHVTTTELNKIAKDYADGIYTWEANVAIDMAQFKDEEGNIDESVAAKAIRNMKITDTLSGPHQLQKELDLEIMIGEYNATNDFKNTAAEGSTKEFVLVPKDASVDALLNALKNDQTITLTYKTQEDKAGNVGDIKNKLGLEFQGEDRFVETPGKPGLISKGSSLSREVHHDGKAHINWTVTANSTKREFDELKLTDVLPEGTDHNEVSHVLVNGQSLENVKGVTMVEGWVTSTNPVAGKNPYGFTRVKPENDKNARAALQFIFDKSFSTHQISITFQTAHEWGSDYHTNLVGAATNEGIYQYTSKRQDIDEETRDGGMKDGKLHLDTSPRGDNNYVTWTLRFGSHLNHYFGKAEGQTDTITVTDTLNGDGPRYLSFPGKKTDFTLYSLDSNRNNPKEIGQDLYDIDWDKNSDSRGKRAFTITFNDKVPKEGYTNFQLVFNTPIDISAWEKVDNPPSHIPNTHKFENTADVEYANKHIKDLEASESLASEGLYGQKTAKEVDGSFLNWEIIVNALGQDIGKPEINDTLTENHRHSVDRDDIELAFITPKYTTINNGSGYKVEVDKSKPQDILPKTDYSVDYDGNQKMTIQLKTKVDRPLVIRYKTIMNGGNGEYRNNARISVHGYSTQYTAKHDITGSASMEDWTLRFLKVDGSDKDKPLAGATFKLQQLNKDGKTWDEAKRMDNGEGYGEVESGPDGLLQFHSLGTRAEYRLVEVSPPKGHSSQMNPLQFNKKDALAAGWDKETHKIKNYSTTPGNLTLSKATKNLDNENSFKFEVRAVDEEGNVNTGLQGTYEIPGVGEVSFHNGVSEEIAVPANKERTIIGLPTEKVDADGNTSAQYYDVRETSTSDKYNTQVAVGNDDPVWGKQTKPFKLSTSTAAPVMIFFTNTAATGDLVVNKTVSSKTEDEINASYEFTIEADKDSKTKVANKTYKTEGTRLNELKFKDDGTATFSLKHAQQLKVKGLPEGVKLTVTEKATGMVTTWSVNGDNYVNSTEPVTISTDETQIYDFKNSSQPTGQLQITKQIAGAIPADEVFKFEIKADSSVDGKYPYETYTVSNQHPGQAGTLEFENGKLTTPLSLKGDEYVKIKNLPLNQAFTVRELPLSDKDIETTWQIGTSKEEGMEADPITLKDENDIASVTFTNQLPNGSLTLGKNVVGLPGDYATKFDFTIQAEDANSIDKVRNKTFTDAYNVVHEVDFDKDGKANISLRDSQRVKILGLPAGINLRISEANNPDFNASYKVDDEADEEDADGPSVTIEDNENTAVSYTNTRTKKGELIVSKTVSSTNKDELDAKYHFTVQADPTDEVANKTFEADGAGLDELEFDSKGRAELDLKDGQRLKILGLPVGVEFKVTETTPETDMDTTWSINGGDYTNNDKSVTISGQKPQIVDFKNSSYPTGQLQITKQIAGSISADEVFKFVVKTDSSVNGKYSYETYTVSNQHPGAAGTLEFENGRLTTPLSLKGDEYIRIKNLPLNKEFAVKELAPDNSDIKTTWQIGTTKKDGRAAEPITLKDENDIANVTFTNTLLNGSLTLTKRVLGAPQDPGTAFEFTIEASDDSLEKVRDKTFQVDADFMDEIHFNDDGQATLKLRDTQRVKILGLPGGITLRISENSHPDFNVSYNVGNGEEKEDEAGPAVTVQEGKNTTVNFTNTGVIKGGLMLEKRAEGSFPVDKTVRFMINATALDGEKDPEKLNGDFEATLTKNNGSSTQQKVSFENGTARVAIKPGESLLIKNLDSGSYQVSERRQGRHVVTTWDIGNTSGIGLRTDEVKVDGNDTAHVLFTNKIATGKLELNKFVASHDDADKDKEFKFEIQTINDDDKALVAAKSYEISGYAGTKRIEFDEDGIAKLSLKDGQTATISGLPAGIEFKVVETETHDLDAFWNVNNLNDYEKVIDDNYPEVTITENQSDVVSYRNVRDPVGSLRVDKVVKGAYTDDNRKFEFEVAAQKEVEADPDAETETEGDTDAETEVEGEDDKTTWVTDDSFNGEYSVRIYSSDNELQESLKVTFEDGIAKLELKADQYAVINGLPLKGEDDKDAQFQVSEVDPEIGNMSTTWAVDNGTATPGLVAEPVALNDTDVPKVKFTNSLETGSLVLDKKLSGAISDADRNQTFEFTVDAQTEDIDEPGEWKTDETFAGDYVATKTDADGRQTTSNVTFTDGQLAVHLKGGERLQIHNLPAGTHMVVNENVDGDYNTSHQIDHGSVTPGATTDQITILNGDDLAVTFINERPVLPQDAWLSLTKSVIGENGERDRGFEFNVRFLDDQMNPVTGTIDFVKTSSVGGYEPGQMMLEEDGSGSFALMDGETIRWQLPNGTHYQITESDYSADGYSTSISQGQEPEREGLTTTGVAMANDPVNARVVYYNRADPTPEDEPHTPEDPETTTPELVPPAPESGGADTEAVTEPGSGTQATTGTTGTAGTTRPQAYVGGTGSKGFLPQTGEWLKQNWLLVLGLVILLSTVGLIIRSKRKKS
ncbi:T surface-antigen of pili [Secundilactobacillus pentosiphilus]|uniref:T surface-antigen of pili n=1 Tax=Secundilactobacillus pentosiphilus TaxID=1714682 RepID=A0A1Z5IWJ3_9LACO|nr:adhesive domain-containing protein [Secundilactobacillus pentosiphilus]GAX06133.1 T surface-antigen of pili [Secundilactobacillus pentosiphilus]